MVKILVTGAGGFIGHHLVTLLKQKGYWVRGVDIKKPEFANTDANEFQLLDLKKIENCVCATQDMEHVFHLAANMGGIGFIETHKADIVYENTVIDMHMLQAAKINNVQKFLYTSSACIYPGYKQDTPDITPLKEEDAYPALPEDGYGWEKLYVERACRHYHEDYGLKTYVVRFHNIFGPLGTYDGGREKSPAAICRKIALAKSHDEIEVWGDGKQTRSYCYIEDCVTGMYKLMQSNHHSPLNLGQDRLITINELVDIVANIAGKKITKKYDLSKPQGVRGRNSDNTLLAKVLNWSPEVELEVGLEATYKWIEEQLRKDNRI